MAALDDLFSPATHDSAPQVFITAEVGVNHDGRLKKALELVDAAARVGADAVKLQLFHPDRLLSNQARLAAYQHGNAGDVYNLLAELTLDLDEIAAASERAHRHGLRFVVTPFSIPDVADLDSLEVDAVKIASPDAVNAPLVAAAAALNKPLLISTGTCELQELNFVAGLLREHASGGALLHCVSSYPTPSHAAALGAVRAMQEVVGLPVGYSDHTPDVDTGALAVAVGAVLLEKHLTYDRSAKGPDHSASLDPDRFAEYVLRVRDAQQRIGPCVKRLLEVEGDVRDVSRQSICATGDLLAGHKLTAADLTCKRPGTGIPAMELASLIGIRLSRKIRRNDLVHHDDLAA